MQKCIAFYMGSDMKTIIKRIEDVRTRWSVRMDAEEENNNNEPKKKGRKKYSAFSTRLPYGLCKDIGIDTTGMTPREAWDAYYGKTGISPSKVKKEKMGEIDDEPEKTKDESPKPTTESKKLTQEELITKHNEIAEERKKFMNDFDKEHDGVSMWKLLQDRKGYFGGVYAKDPQYKEVYDKYDELTKKWREAKYDMEHYSESEPKTGAEKALASAERLKEETNWATADYGAYDERTEALREKYKDACIKWADEFSKDGYKLQEEDYSAKDALGLDGAYRRMDTMIDMVNAHPDSGIRFEAREALMDERKKITDAYKEKLKEKHGKEIDSEDIDTSDLSSKTDKELKAMSSDLKKREKKLESISPTFYDYGVIVDYTMGNGALRDLKSGVDQKKKAVAEELKKRAEVSFNKKWQKPHESKESAPSYDKPVLQGYSAKAPKPKVATGIKTLDGWQSCADSYMNNNASDKGTYGIGKDEMWGMSSEELVTAQKNLQSIFNGAELCLNINSANVDKVLMGHLMNQFESGTTDGSSDLDARRKMSNNIFGTPPGIKKEDREKYGYMADKEDFDGTVGAGGPWYGKKGSGARCCFVFRKDRVQDRTTYTFGDSLSAAYDFGHHHYAAGMVDTDCSIEGVSYGTKHAELLKTGEAKSVKDMFGDNGWNYLECQYHGGITAKDIDNVRFRNYHDMKNAIKSWDKQAMDVAEENGIRFSYYDQLDKKFVYLSAKEAREKASKLY